jgi:hypothetical protein
MKKNCACPWKLLALLLGIFTAGLGTLFIIYMWNLDMKGVGFIYKWLNKFHDRKPVDTAF